MFNFLELEVLCPTNFNTDIYILLCVYFSGGNLSHQLSACSAVSLPSKIDNIGSDDDLEDIDDPEFEVNDDEVENYDDEFTPYDEDECDSEGESGSRSAADTLSSRVEDSHLHNTTYLEGRKSPNRKLGQRYVRTFKQHYSDNNSL